MTAWRMVSERTREGASIASYFVCDACWPAHTVPVGETSSGSNTVAVIQPQFQKPGDTCRYCEQHPAMKGQHANASY